MADKKPRGDENAPAPKKKSKLLLFIIIGVVVLSLVGGGAFFLLKKKSAHGDEEGAAEEAPAKAHNAKKEKKEGPPVFVKLEAFTVKLQSEGQDSYLQVTPELRVLDAHTGEKVKQFTPEIRHHVLLILSAKKPADVTSSQGMQSLSNEIRATINQIIDGPKKGRKKGEETGLDMNLDPDDSVQAVLFTSFIVQ